MSAQLYLWTILVLLMKCAECIQFRLLLSWFEGCFLLISHPICSAHSFIRPFWAVLYFCKFKICPQHIVLKSWRSVLQFILMFAIHKGKCSPIWNGHCRHHLIVQHSLPSPSADEFWFQAAAGQVAYAINLDYFATPFSNPTFTLAAFLGLELLVWLLAP